MSPLVFRTALPFGYLLLGGALAILGVAAIALLIEGLRRRRYLRAGTGILLLGLLTPIVWLNVAAGRDLDLNPIIRADSVLVGIWRDGASELELRADHSFVCSDTACQDLVGAGTWARAGDFELTFRPTATGEQRRRVVRYRDHLRLTTVTDDPDMWDGKMTFAIASAP